MAKKTNYQVTIGYRAVITYDVKADSEDEAKKIAIAEFHDHRKFGKNSTLQDDTFNAYGVLDMDKTWNAL